jgi:hypothetical protein
VIVMSVGVGRVLCASCSPSTGLTVSQHRNEPVVATKMYRNWQNYYNCHRTAGSVDFYHSRTTPLSKLKVQHTRRERHRLAATIYTSHGGSSFRTDGCKCSHACTRMDPHACSLIYSPSILSLCETRVSVRQRRGCTRRQCTRYTHKMTRCYLR